MYVAIVIGIAIVAVAVTIAATATKMPEIVLCEKLPIDGVLQKLKLGAKPYKIDLRAYCKILLRKNKTLSKRLCDGEANSGGYIYFCNCMFVERILLRAYRQLKGMPKQCGLYTVCSTAVAYTHGDVSDGLRAMIEDIARETGDEYCARFFKPVLDICICAFLLCRAEHELDSRRRFERGCSDGKNGDIDLNRLHSSAYVSGLYRGCGNDCDTFDRITEINGADKGELFFEYMRDRGECATDIFCALRSLGKSNIVGIAGAENALFGDIEYAKHALNGKTCVVTDSHGNCTVGDRRLQIEIDVNGDKITLRDCDGSFQPYRTVYRTVGMLEFAVEIISPLDFDGALCKITVIGSSDALRARLTVKGDGIAACDGFTAFDGELVCELDLQPFRKIECTAALVLGDGMNRERVADMMRYDGYYERALVGVGSVKCTDIPKTEIPFATLFLHRPSSCITGVTTNELAHFDDGVYYTDGINFAHRPLSKIAVQTGGKLFLPFCGGYSVKCAVGYEEYVSLCADIVFTLRRYRYENREIYDLSFTSDCAAKVLFVCGSGAIARAYMCDGVAYIESGIHSGVDFAVYCSENIDEFSPYRESYCSHGKIDRAHGLRDGGVTVGPAIVCTCGKHVCRVAFCTEKIGKATVMTDKFDITMADKIFADINRFYEKAVSPFTSDRYLDFCCTRAFFAATDKHTDDDGNMDLLRTLVELSAEPSRVYGKLIEICGSQLRSGEMSAHDALVFPIAAYEYSVRTGDELDERVGFADGGSATVAEHCLLAIEFCAELELDMCSQAILFLSVARFLDKTEHTRRKQFIYYASKIRTEMENYISDGRRCDGRDETLIMASLCCGSKKLSSRIISELENSIECAEVFVQRLGACFSLLYANVLYADDKYARAYEILRAVTDYLIAEHDGAPRIVSDGDRMPDAAALYYLTVSEKLFGISMKSGNFVLSPCIAENTPHIEYDLRSCGKPLHVTVDDGGGDGSWNIRMGRIVCGTNTVGKNHASPIVLFKNGCQTVKRVI